MLPLCSHLALKRGVFYYRRKFPFPHSGEIAISLRTKHFRDAQHLARVADSVFVRFFRSAVRMADVRTILHQHLAEALSDDREVHLATRHGRPVYASVASVTDDLSPTDADLDLISDLLGDAREALATHCQFLNEYHRARAIQQHIATQTRSSRQLADADMSRRWQGICLVRE